MKQPTRKPKLKPARVNKDLSWNRRKVFSPTFPARRRRLTKAALWLGFLTGSVLVIFNSQFWKINAVNCNPMIGSAVADWCAAVQAKVLGGNIFLVNAAGLEEILQLQYPALDKITLRRKWPAALEIGFTVRTPFLAVNNESPESTVSGSPRNYFVVDETGLVFARSAAVGGLLTINYQDGPAPRVGTYLEKGFLLFVVNLLKEFKRLGLIAVSAWLETSTLVVQLQDGPAVYFSAEKETGRQALTLQLVLEKYRIEGRVLKRVDLRFKDPVVEY